MFLLLVVISEFFFTISKKEKHDRLKLLFFRGLYWTRTNGPIDVNDVSRHKIHPLSPHVPDVNQHKNNGADAV